MTREEVERVAEALFLCDGFSPPAGVPDPRWEDQPEAVKAAHRKHARAALSASPEYERAGIACREAARFEAAFIGCNPPKHHDDSWVQSATAIEKAIASLNPINPELGFDPNVS